MPFSSIRAGASRQQIAAEPIDALDIMVSARTAELRDLLAHVEATREEEKRTLARELHDDLGSSLTALNMQLAILFRQMPNDPRLKELAAQIKTLSNSIAQSTRRMQASLRPDKLDAFGLKVAIADQASEFENFSGLKCRVSLPDEELHYSPQVEIALFRIVQEGLNNIARHANASVVDIVLDDNEDGIMLSIRDNGIGIPAGVVSARMRNGLRGVRERAAYFGGALEVRTDTGKGTCLIITLPKPPGPDPETEGR